MHYISCVEHANLKYIYWMAWKSLLHLDFNAGASLCAVPNRGWKAVAQWSAFRRISHRLAIMRTSIYLFLGRLRPFVKVIVMRDRFDFLNRKAYEAQVAAYNGDSRTAYTIVKMLAGGSASSSKSVKLSDGSVANSEHERQMRWQEHFCNVFNGKITELSAKSQTTPEPMVEIHNFHTSPELTRKAHADLGRNKGCGPDTIPAEVLQAGESALAVKYFDLESRIVRGELWPEQWQGGRIIDLFKGKGDRLVCDHSRGLLLADHSSKAFASQLKSYVDPVYELAMPINQHGATRGRGTDFASHIVRSLIGVADVRCWSVFALFLDLIKAYDRVIRELVLGWPSNIETTGLDYLLNLGVNTSAAEWIAAFVDRTGGLLKLWGVDPKVRVLIAAMHTGSWFRYGDLQTIISTSLGGRQGCKFGSLIFNGGYSVALAMVHDELIAAGITLKLHESPDAFWSSVDLDSDQEHAVDATFVDDECLVIMAATPSQLDTSIDILLSAVVRVFKCLSLDINWKPGKSECMLRYRGKGAAAKYEQRRADGKLRVRVKDIEGCYLTVVESYKHLGGVISIRGDIIADANHKLGAAMTAYVPIALKIFGDHSVSDFLKLHFAQMLIHTRLFFNAHIVVSTTRYISILNRGYMRVLRRIADCVNFDGTAGSDIEVRSKSNQPSVDCMLQRLRLRYLRRLILRNPPTLLALLHYRHTSKHSSPQSRTIGSCRDSTSGMQTTPSIEIQLAWTRLLRVDLRVLWQSVLSERLPDPDESPQMWAEFIAGEESRWTAAVAQLFYVGSVCDRTTVASLAASVQPAIGLTCRMCVGTSSNHLFPDSKALLQHMRVKHGERVFVRKFVGADGICPICMTDFRERFRCIAHLSDSRRQKCANLIFERKLIPLPDEQVQKLDELERAAKTAAKKDGHTHILATASAVTADGKRIGRVQR